MSGLTTTPVCSSCPPVESTKAFLDKFLSGLVDTLIVRWQHPAIKRGRSWSLQLLNKCLPFIWNGRVPLVNSKEINTGSSMWNIVILSIHPEKGCTIFILLKVADYSIPRGTTDVLKDYKWRPVFVNPRHHTTESSPRFTVRVDILLLIIQRRIIYTGGTRNKQINIPRYCYF